MKALKVSQEKKSKKQDRKLQVLFGAIDYYIKTGKAVGSDTLKNSGFELLSSATIRNYFAQLEDEGFLIQTHTSGGRIPTEKGFKVYAAECANELQQDVASNIFQQLGAEETREITRFLNNAANFLSDAANGAVFLSAPRFDQDYIIDIKLIPIDHQRALSVIVTDFGVVQTEILHTQKKLNAFSAKRIESYFQFRLSGRDLPENLEKEEEELAQKLYNELMVRYIVGYTNFTEREIMRTGFSKLLTYPDFQDASKLSSSLSLFENVHSMRLLLKECAKQNRLRFWIGDDLSPFAKNTPDCTVVAVPYYINNQSIGAIGILTPTRIPYRKLFNLLNEFSHAVSQALTRSIYKYKINFRQPKQESLDMQKVESRLLGTSHFMLLENHFEAKGEE
ncbi:MAG TPA: heat-inducible transcriptional repressor HrcA [Parachlamydiaceae bacterium]|nr:heat-inducible transcriptional repressor HrcA [Parachlamydiaceae bacterium]